MTEKERYQNKINEATKASARVDSKIERLHQKKKTLAARIEYCKAKMAAIDAKAA